VPEHIEPDEELKECLEDLNWEAYEPLFDIPEELEEGVFRISRDMKKRNIEESNPAADFSTHKDWLRRHF